ncbi:MAG: CbiX/SirB N-terminal domain-containing protein [Rhodoferax sp.]|uniref:sirohydrochlorin chelatase n=1 Tax=Rhodoferax sp. TaxID=50421 RepID=UPI00271BB851|nr:CbiX/SirB N-terminal domain-containing protein [Rhodoferax sp.]MDO8450674.1 CbiX/SirB N-terminal domain-containing protein [Rhodoferax sp.]
MQSDTARGTILFGHGSRDPLWRKPIEAVASHIQGIAPEIHVRCAYLELTVPDLPTTAAELSALGVTTITVVPMFLGVGRHARDDLPLLMAALQHSHPHIEFALRPAIGEETLMIELMARIALS